MARKCTRALTFGNVLYEWINELYSSLVKQIFIVKQNFKLNTDFEQYYFCDKLDVSKLWLM